MTPAIAGLVLVSAVAHPVWNLLAKRAASPDGAMVGLHAVLALFALAHALAGGAPLGPPAGALPLIFVSAAGQAVYVVGLTQVLRAHDLSVGYPLVRAAPVAMLAVDVLFLGGRHGWPALVGVAAMTAGGMWLQRQGTSGRPARPRTAAAPAFLAMCGTVAYSLADGRLTAAMAPETVVLWTQAMALPAVVATFMILGRKDLFGWLAAPGRVGLAGGLAYGAYWLVLKAFQMGGPVPTVSALRQLSIPVAVLLGWAVLKEGGLLQRLGAAALMAAGAALIVTGR